MTSRAGQGGFNEWQELRDHAIELFHGELPHPITEQDIINAYDLHPDAVARAVDSIAVDLHAGTIRTGWGVLRTRAAEIRKAPSSPKASTGRDREKRIARAEQWIQNAGIHFDLETEIQDELFGRGLLRDYTNDEKLIERMLDHWRAHRPTGERVEAEAEQRAQDWKQARARIAQMARDRLAALEAELPEPEYALVGETPPPDETLIPEEPE